MTLNALTFAITTREIEPLGLAVLCVEAAALDSHLQQQATELRNG